MAVTSYTPQKNSSYSDLHVSLSGIFSENKLDAENAMALVAQHLQTFGKQGIITALSEILNNQEKIEEISKRSYLHGNGFYKIILEETNLFRLRLHIWNQGVIAEENIHDHRWHFASTIISGKMKSEIWEDAISNNGEFLDEYLYVGKTKIQDAYLNYLGKSRVALQKTCVYEEGDAYFLLSNIMHKITYSGEEQISTLTCHSNDARNWARTITRKQSLPNVEHNYLDSATLKYLLTDYLFSIKK